MWAEIHNSLQHADWAKELDESQSVNYERLKEITKETFDFEKLFQIVAKGNDYIEMKDAFNKCVFDAYKDMDDNVIGSVSNDTKLNFSINGIRNLIERFAKEGRGSGTSFFFSLNQDIYIERQFYNYLHPLCVKTHDAITYLNSGGRTPFENHFSPVPTEDSLNVMLEKLKLESENLHYVKLHGSFNWVRSDGNNMMVIGTSKDEDINNEPILKWYKDLFENVLSKEDCRLLIIGYGFADPHINNIILESIKKKRGLRIYIICPADPEDFKNKILINIGCEEDEYLLWKAISAYYPYTFEKLFPQDSDSRKYYELTKQYFES